MQRINQFLKSFSKTSRFSEQWNKLNSWIFISSKSKNVDFSMIRISPTDAVFPFKEQFIPLARNTVIRKLSQDPVFVSNVNQPLFEKFNKYLKACIYNRNYFFLKEIKASYGNLNPDVEVLSGGIKWPLSRRQILDEEFSFMQKFSRMLELANFSEINRHDLEKWLKNHGGLNSIQIWVDANKYEVLKVWLLGRGNSGSPGVIQAFWDKYLSGVSLKGNPFRWGNRYKRVVVAVRAKDNHNKIELKMFKDLSEGELIHTVPQVDMGHSAIDNSVLMWTAVIFITGWSTHLILPVATLDSGWLSSTHHLAASLAFLSGGVGLLQWNMIQNKKSSYWKWRSELNYKSIIANNRGVINLLGDRVRDEIFKESILAYIHILTQTNGISQRELESHVRAWALENCNLEFKETSANMEMNLTEALSLLRQLNIVTLDQSTELLSAKPLELSTATLGTEFKASNLSVDLDGNTIIRNDDINSLADQPIVEGYEQIHRTANVDK